MKSNVVNIKNAHLFKVMSCVAILLSYTQFASADEQVEKSRNQLSQLGIETGLPLYDRDKADTCVPGALQIRVTVHNVFPKGIVKLELFGEKDFLKKKGKLRRIRVPAGDGSQQICINLPTPGEYAVVGYHDIDADRRLKKAWNYKPKEPYGLSNNPKMKSLSLPKWSQTKFGVPMEGVDIDINLVDLSAKD